MPHFYLDTSAMVKRYNEEDGSEFVNGLYDFQRIRGERLHTSILANTEFCSAIWRKVREKRMNPETAERIVYYFLTESDEMLIYFGVDRPLIQESMRFVSTYPMKAYDAIHLATCFEAREYASKDEGDFYFVCDDEQLCLAAESESLKVLKPRSSAAHDELIRLRMA